MRLPDTSIIGTGALGTTLARALVARDVPVKSIFNRTVSKARALSRELEIDISGDLPTASDQLGSLIFLTISDGSIAEVAHKLSELSADLGNYTFVHCSGNESAELLEPLKMQGANIAAFHPLQTFTSRSTITDFEGIYFSLQGDGEALSMLRTIANKLGADTFDVTNEQKSHLHAAAVFASNYLTTLLDTSVKVGAQEGLPEEKVKEVLLPLVRKTLENASRESFSEALSGPVKRGDIATVQQHLQLLGKHPELKRVYCMLGLQTLKLAEQNGSIGGTDAEQLRKMFHKALSL